MAKATSGSILGVIQKESWILDHFEIFVICAWQRSALFECFSNFFSFTAGENNTCTKCIL